VNADEIREAVGSILAGEADDATALGEVVALLAKERPLWTWVGIYLLKGETLILGPYVGPETNHTRIPVGVGVCGTAVFLNDNLVIRDVRQVENYLACSATTRSEIVVLIKHKGEIVGQFDVDSDQVGAFGPDDEILLEDLAVLAGPRCRKLAKAAK
jgi:GAF domain-containing protein